MRIAIWILIAVFFVFGSVSDTTFGDVILSEVTSVYDGDTFRGNIKEWPGIIGYRIGIRIAGIDCPDGVVSGGIFPPPGIWPCA